MSNELVNANQFDDKQLDMIKEMYFKGSTDLELQAFLHVCKRTGLDPFLKQVYPVKRWDSKASKEVLTVQTSIDGYRLIAERSGKYSPGRETTYVEHANGNLISATSYIKKQTPDGSWHEVGATAYYDEYVQTDKAGKPTKFWEKMKRTMLSKCAEALALRKAFPADMSGIYTKEEMAQADIEDISGDVEVVPKATPVKMVNHAPTISVTEKPQHKPAESLTIDDLLTELKKVDVYIARSGLEELIIGLCAEKNLTQTDIIRSALTSDKALEKLKKLVNEYLACFNMPSENEDTEAVA